MSATIENVFKTLNKEKRVAFMPFFVAGFPNFSKSLDILTVAAKYADIIELGVPYSDPIADGPVIQKANYQAISSGVNINKIFSLVRRLRRRGITTPIVLMSYVSLVLRKGADKFFEESNRSGINGVILPDVPFEESKHFFELAIKNKLDYIPIISLTTSRSRIFDIVKFSSGFFYLVSTNGTTGARDLLDPVCLENLEVIKPHSLGLPLCVGFGIQNTRQVDILVKKGVNGYIIGSAIIDFISKNYRDKGFMRKFDGYLISLKV